MVACNEDELDQSLEAEGPNLTLPSPTLPYLT